MDGFSPLRADDDAAAKVKAFREKFATQPAASGASAAQTEQMKLRASGRLRLIEAALARDEIDVARLIVATDVGEFAEDFREEWLNLRDALLTSVEKMKVAARERWYAQVEELVKDARRTCLAAKTADDMDPLMLRVAALQMQRLGQDTILGQRAEEKMKGVVDLVQRWTQFLDNRTAKYAAGANLILQRLASNPPAFPILTAEEIEAQLLPVTPVKKPPYTNLKLLIFGIASPADVAAALGRWKELELDVASEGVSYETERRRLETIDSAWAAAKRSDDDATMRTLETVGWDSGLADLLPRYGRLREQVIREMVANKSRSWPCPPLAAADAIQPYLLSALDALQTKGNFGAMSEVMSLYDRVSSTPRGSQFFARDRQTIERFLAGQRFEAVGEASLAVVEYRAVLGAGGGKYVPLKETGEAMKQLKEKSPEAFTDQNALQTELRNLRQQLQILQNRPAPSRPNSP